MDMRIKLKCFGRAAYSCGLLILLFQANFAASCQTGTNPHVEDRQFFYFTSSVVFIPVGYFLLIRRGAEVGAIRISDISPPREDNQGLSHFESYYLAHSTKLTPQSHFVHKSGHITVGSMRGPIHSLTFETGHYWAHVGPWRFAFISPQTMTLMDGFWDRTKGFEFAGTSANTFEEIDFFDPKLKWLPSDGQSSKMPAISLAK